MKRLGRLIAVASATCAFAAPAFADVCPPVVAPPPESARPIKPGQIPDMPECAHKDRCHSRDIDAYNAQVAAYNRGVNDYNTAARTYLDAMNAFIRSANEYSRCELDIMNGVRSPSAAPTPPAASGNDPKAHGG